MKRTVVMLVILLLATPSWSSKLDIDPVSPKPIYLAKADSRQLSWQSPMISKQEKKQWKCRDCGHDDVAFAAAVEAFLFLVTMAIRSHYLR